MTASEGRLAGVRNALVREHLDALLVTHLPNIRYLTGFAGTSALVLVTPRDTVLVTDFRYEEQARHECARGVAVVVEPASIWNGLWESLGRDEARVVGFESAHLSHAEFQKLTAQDRWTWRPSMDVVETLRVAKSEAECATIRRAAEVAQSALETVLVQLRLGMSELEVCGRLEYALRAAGSAAHPFPAIVASGPRSALPHARPSSRALTRGDFLLLDFGATVDGYCSDITRTVVLGAASDRQRAVYDVVREANARAAAGVRPGMIAREADAIARSYIEDAGFGAQFGHSLGHGLGLEVHEAPRVSRLSEEPLPIGAVVTIEPGVYVPDWGGVRIEDNVWLASGGCQLLTTYRRDLVELDI